MAAVTVSVDRHSFPAGDMSSIENSSQKPYIDRIEAGPRPAGNWQKMAETMELKKVTMNLTEQDIANTAILTSRLNSRNKASTVSSALAITEGITRKIEDGGELMIRKKDGSMEALIIAGLGGAKT